MIRNTWSAVLVHDAAADVAEVEGCWAPCPSANLGTDSDAEVMLSLALRHVILVLPFPCPPPHPGSAQLLAVRRPVQAGVGRLPQGSARGRGHHRTVHTAAAHHGRAWGAGDADEAGGEERVLGYGFVL